MQRDDPEMRAAEGNWQRACIIRAKPRLPNHSFWEQGGTGETRGGVCLPRAGVSCFMQASRMDTVWLGAEPALGGPGRGLQGIFGVSPQHPGAPPAGRAHVTP